IDTGKTLTRWPVFVDHFKSIVRACRHYMNSTPDRPGIEELNFSLGAVRKVVGINIGELLKHYEIQVSHELHSIIPK
ncbi:hypothetical protein UQ82_24550, partial [Shigella dysenteriae]